MTPKITVIMPSLNVADYIDECITSVLNQTLTEIEILCIDAGSTDGTYEKLHSYSQSDSRIKLIHSDVKSYGYQVNLGISLAKGDFITIIETDDFVDVNILNKLYKLAEAYQLDYIKSNYERYLLYHGRRVYIPEDCLPKTNDCSYNQVINTPKQVADLNCYDYNIWRTLYRKDFLISNNIKCLETPGAAYQDIGFCYKVMKYARRVMYVPDYFYKYCAVREQSSCFNTKVIQYCYDEFSTIKKDEFSTNDSYDIQAYYYKLSQYTLAEVNRLLTIIDCNLDNKNFYPYYDWLKNEFQDGIAQGWLQSTTPINLFIESPDKLIAFFMSEQQKKLSFLKKLKLYSENNQPIAFWGFGNDGRKLLISSIQNNIYPDIIIDNSCTYTNNMIYPVTFEQIKNNVKDYIFVISSSKYYDEIKSKLLQSGINESRIL